jgi:hypothetical protein
MQPHAPELFDTSKLCRYSVNSMGEKLEDGVNLVLLQPFLQQLLQALSQHRTGEFQRLEVVGFAIFQDPKVL